MPLVIFKNSMRDKEMLQKENEKSVESITSYYKCSFLTTFKALDENNLYLVYILFHSNLTQQSVFCWHVFLITSELRRKSSTCIAQWCFDDL